LKSEVGCVRCETQRTHPNSRSQDPDAVSTVTRRQTKTANPTRTDSAATFSQRPEDGSAKIHRSHTPSHRHRRGKSLSPAPHTLHEAVPFRSTRGAAGEERSRSGRLGALPRENWRPAPRVRFSNTARGERRGTLG
ncbi:unnamed protein product, partial [Ixodes pacificus]